MRGCAGNEEWRTEGAGGALTTWLICPPPRGGAPRSLLAPGFLVPAPHGHSLRTTRFRSGGARLPAPPPRHLRRHRTAVAPRPAPTQHLTAPPLTTALGSSVRYTLLPFISSDNQPLIFYRVAAPVKFRAVSRVPLVKTLKSCHFLLTTKTSSSKFNEIRRMTSPTFSYTVPRKAMLHSWQFYCIETKRKWLSVH